jgi:hypothetical protein
MDNPFNCAQWLWDALRRSIPTALIRAWACSALYKEPFRQDLAYAFAVVAITQVLVAGGRVLLPSALQEVEASPARAFASLLRSPRVWMMTPWFVGCAATGYVAGVTLVNCISGHHRTVVPSLSHLQVAPVITALTLVPLILATAPFARRSLQRP